MKRFNLTYTLLLFCLSFAFGQSTTITGNVYDALTNAPLSNYTVTSNGGGGSTTTNASGAYTLVVPTTNDFHVILAAQNGKCYRQKWTWGRKVIDFYLTACNNDRSRDSIALRSLYDNLNGASWTNPWNLAQPITTWGLGYSTNGGGPIEFVGLDNRNLNGTFPTAATGFSNLKDLFGFQFLGYQTLTGTLPSLSNMKQLDYVKIQDTGMSGDPLSSIAGLRNIEFLRLIFNNNMSVRFPSTISTDWRNIYTLQLESVNLSGTIPTALFALPNLQTVGLGQNKLTGTVPSLPIGNGSTIKYLILNDNDLDSLPNLSVSANLIALGVKGNRLTFDDIIPNLSKFNAATIYEGSANSFVYAPQDSFFVDTMIRASENTPLSIDVKIDGGLTNSKYRWYKNGGFFRSTTSTKLTFTNLATTDAGVYTCDVTNALAPLLTLQSRNITIQVTAQSCRTRDSLVLVTLYNATAGANWTVRDTLNQKSPWLLQNPITSWFGIRTNGTGCVTGIDLDGVSDYEGFRELVTGNNLVGTLPLLDSLTNLTGLFLNFNQLRGNIPDFNLPNLQYLTLSNNQLTGTIPYFHLPNLEYLGLTVNRLSGSIPNFNTSNLPKIKAMYLNGDSLMDSIPDLNLPTLQDLSCYGNLLTGAIPNFNLPNLLSLNLAGNQLTGSIPNFNLPNLGQLILAGNQLSGSIPAFNNLRRLGTLLIYDNKLTGCIPAAIKTNCRGIGATGGDVSMNAGLNTQVWANYWNNGEGACCAAATSQTLTPPSVCTVYTSPSGKIFSTSGTYQDTLKTTNSCDSILYTINLTVQNTAMNQTLTPSVCTAFTSPSGKFFNTSGTYRDTVRITSGCDSIRYTINLTIAPTATNQTLIKSACTSYTSPSGKVFNTSGIYKDTLKTTSACDSIRYTINLIIAPTATSQVLTPSVCTAYISPSGKIFNTSGTYRDTLKTINGCDSIRYTINLTIQNTATSQILNPSICLNQTYRSPSGKTFSTAGVKLDTLKNRNGCDSIRFTINLTIQTPQLQQIPTQFFCRGDVFGNIVLTRDTVLKDTLRSIALCDSVIATTLIKVNPPSVNNLNLSLCTGSSVTVNSVVYNATNRSGQQILRAASAAGCDSIINISTSFIGAIRAIDDEYTILDSTNTLNFNVLDNDFVSGNTQVTPLSTPIVGQLDTLGGGRFRYAFPPQTNGTATFDYRVCSTVCPSLCDTASVKININRPRLDGDISFGITPNCVCPNDKFIFTELELNPDKYPANELVIVSRWGDVVYRAKPYHNDWTGTNEKGENLPAGTYYYIMRLAIADGKIKTGDVTIYR